MSSLELPKFSAKILEWPAFNDAFYAAVGSNPNLSNVQKLTHLRSCLRGSALRCIQGYAVINENYPKTLRDLNNRFGRKRLVNSELVKSILALKIPNITDSKVLRYLYDTLRNTLRSLESCKLVATKMPEERLDTLKKNSTIPVCYNCLQWGNVSHNSRTCKEPKCESENTKPFKPKCILKEKQNEEEEKVTSASALLSSIKRETKCGFCTLKHETASCKLAATKTPEERWDTLKKNSTIPVCYNCLQPGNVSHNSRICKKPKCSVDRCGKRHHKLLHTDVIKKEKTNKIWKLCLDLFRPKPVKRIFSLQLALALFIMERSVWFVFCLTEETFLWTNVCDSLGIKETSSSAAMKINMLAGESQQKKVHRVAFKICAH